MTYSATQLQLTHVLQRFYRRVGGKVTLATGGTTTTVIDTKLVDEFGANKEIQFIEGAVGDAVGSKEAAWLAATFLRSIGAYASEGYAVLLLDRACVHCQGVRDFVPVPDKAIHTPLRSYA